MAKLILSLSGNYINEFKLKPDVTRIGRRPHNEIQVDHLSISGEHALIRLMGGEYIIEDQRSTNGTSVNGQRIVQYKLKDGDQIRIGKHVFTFRVSDAVARPPSNDGFEATQLLVPPTSAARPEGKRTGVVRVLTGTSAGREVILAKASTTLGKAGVQVASIGRRSEGYAISHVEGPKRPLVNNREIGSTPHPLKEEDLIELAGVKMAFFYR
ncbi:MULTISPECIES: FHA domain-containing protein [Silvimonas]|uniref:FHA domain-containing protein n=1 Tax=Silvimonas TaxID=300264 RepID=UPI0024B36AED|nr:MULTISPECIES: FHA domain-containing protein [Silvimonas]MDR3428838.1 FHA domain-containing protein [Silvimonas sp.]